MSEGPRYERILVGTNGTPTAKHAVERAAQIAKRDGAELHVVTGYSTGERKTQRERTFEVLQRHGADEQWRTAQASLRTIQTEDEAEAILLDARRDWESSGIAVYTHGREGDPVDIILAMAEEIGADLIIVGNVGMRAARRFPFIRNVPDEVSHNAPCDVLIVHTEAQQDASAGRASASGT